MPTVGGRHVQVRLDARGPVGLGTRSRPTEGNLLNHVRHVRHVLLAVAVLAAPLGIAGRAHEATATPGAALGAYSGPGDVPALEGFSNWLGRSPSHASDFVDYHRTWNEIANPIWLLDTWSSWVRAAEGRRLVLGVAMVPEMARGQMAAGASGAFDHHFRTLASNMVNRGLGGSVIRVGWEANGNWFPWSAGTDIGSWRSYYRRIVTTMRAVPGAAFAFDWTAASSAAGTNLTLDAVYPGDDVVDIVGLAAYDVMWQDTTSSPEARWDFTLNQFNGLRAHKAFADAHGKALSFPEWGLYARGDIRGGGGDSPYYIDRMADWFQSTNTAYQAYFNADWGAGRLASFPNGQARYKARFGTAPTTTTVPAPPTTIAPATTTTAAPTTTTVPQPTTTVAPTTTTLGTSPCSPFPEPYRSMCVAALAGHG